MNTSDWIKQQWDNGALADAFFKAAISADWMSQRIINNIYSNTLNYPCVEFLESLRIPKSEKEILTINGVPSVLWGSIFTSPITQSPQTMNNYFHGNPRFMECQNFDTICSRFNDYILFATTGSMNTGNIPNESEFVLAINPMSGSIHQIWIVRDFRKPIKAKSCIFNYSISEIWRFIIEHYITPTSEEDLYIRFKAISPKITNAPDNYWEYLTRSDF